MTYAFRETQFLRATLTKVEEISATRIYSEVSPNNDSFTFSDSNCFEFLHIFFARVLTTRRTMLSLIAIFANHLDIQEKIHKEIDSVIGHNKPRLQDRSEMHYTSAVRKFTTSLTNDQLYNFQTSTF